MAATTTPAAPPPSPQAAEATAKAVAKNAADATVATDKNAKHGVVYTVKSPKVWASAAAGAGAGAVVAGPPGALAGAIIGGMVQRHNVAGGPIGKLIDVVKAKWPIKRLKKPVANTAAAKSSVTGTPQSSGTTAPPSAAAPATAGT